MWPRPPTTFHGCSTRYSASRSNSSTRRAPALPGRFGCRESPHARDKEEQHGSNEVRTVRTSLLPCCSSLSLAWGLSLQPKRPGNAGARRVLLLLFAAEYLVEHPWNVVGGLGHIAVGPRLADGLHLALGRSPTPLDDARGVAEALAFRRPGAGDIDHEGLGELARRNHLSTLLFLRPADFGEDRHRFRFLVFFKEGQQIRHRGADHRLSTGMHHGTDSIAALFEHPGNRARLPARAGEHSDRALLEEAVVPVNVTAEPANDGLARIDDADGAGADNAGALLPSVLDHVHDVVHRHALHAGERVLNAGVDRLLDGRQQRPAGDEHYAEVDLALVLDQRLHGVVHGDTVHFLARLARTGASHQVGAVVLKNYGTNLV